MMMLLILILILSYITISNSIVVKYDNTINTYESNTLVKSFGMASGGIITINSNIKSNNNTITLLNDYYILILIVTQSQMIGWYSYNNNNNNNNGLYNLCNSPSQVRYTPNINSINNYTYIINDNDLYNILLLQCYNGNINNTLSISITASLVNIIPYNNNVYTQLPIEEVMIPRVVLFEIIIYIILCISLIFQLYINKRYVKQIHILYIICILFIIIQLIIRYIQIHEIETLGYTKMNMLILYNIFEHISNVISLITLLVISFGLNYGHNVLIREKKIGAIAILCYFIVGFGGAFCAKTTNQCKSIWLVTYVMRSIVILGIIVAMNYSVAQLRAIIINSTWAPSTPWHYHKLQQYQIFRLVFLLYLILPTIFLTIQSTLFTWKDNWIVFLMTELLTLFMCIHIGINFAPDRDDFFNRAFDGTFNNNARRE